jgi:hypothetical protein
MSRTESYLVVAASAAELAADPAVARRWSEPSALPGFTVGGLAEHLAGQVFSVAKALAEPSSNEEQVSLLEHYARASWVRTGRDSEANVSIRDSGEGQAAEGPEAFVARLRTSLADVVVRCRRSRPTTGCARRPGRGRSCWTTSCSPG